MVEQPTEITLHQQSRNLEITFSNDTRYRFSFEFLRVHSPSAEVRGHGQAVLQIGIQNVNVIGIEPVGSYAMKIVFDDGHDSGLYKEISSSSGQETGRDVARIFAPD